MDLAAAVLGLVFTVAVFSYVIGDNPLYRLALHLLVGVSAGYALVVAVRSVLWPPLQMILADPGGPSGWPWLAPVLFAVLLLFKLSRYYGWMGNSSLGAMVGVGAAVALTGAISGTLWPQILSLASDNALVAAVGALLTVAVLLMFQFTGRPGPSGPAGTGQQVVSITGKVVLTLALGAVFAGVLSTSLVLLAERLQTILVLVLPN